MEEQQVRQRRSSLEALNLLAKFVLTPTFELLYELQLTMVYSMDLVSELL